MNIMESVIAESPSAEQVEDIKCNFCKAPHSVFSKTDGSLTCRNCNANYYPLLLPNTKARRMVLQDWNLALRKDPSMGYKIVYGEEGDISESDAEEILKYDEELRPGFSKLNKKFSEMLWYSSPGQAIIDEDTIKDVCRKFAFTFTHSNEDDALTVNSAAEESVIRVTFGRKIYHCIDLKQLERTHELISEIPKRNDNLIRYFVAEGQERLIVLAARKAFDSYSPRKKHHPLAKELCRAICC